MYILETNSVLCWRKSFYDQYMSTQNSFVYISYLIFVLPAYDKLNICERLSIK